MKPKDLLKESYEQIRGKTYSSRQWRRIRNEYLGGKVNLLTVKTHARLRTINGRRALTLSHVDRVQGFEEFASCLDGIVQGQDIYDAFKFLSPSPSPSTIRRWGVSLGIPLIKDRWYTADEAQTWVRFVGDHVRFTFPDTAIKRKA